MMLLMLMSLSIFCVITDTLMKLGLCMSLHGILFDSLMVSVLCMSLCDILVRLVLRVYHCIFGILCYSLKRLELCVWYSHEL